MLKYWRAPLSIIRIHPVIAAILLGLTAGAVHAESPGRFTMSPVDGGFVRLDTDTGAMSLCAKKDGADQADTWSCAPMDDSQRDLRAEVDRLKAENSELKSEVRRLEDTFIEGRRPGSGTDSQGEGPPGGLPPAMKLPSEEQVDKAIDYLEGMIRKFRDRFEEFGEKTDPDRPRRKEPHWRNRDDRRDDRQRWLGGAARTVLGVCRSDCPSAAGRSGRAEVHAKCKSRVWTLLLVQRLVERFPIHA